MKNYKDFLKQNNISYTSCYTLTCAIALKKFSEFLEGDVDPGGYKEWMTHYKRIHAPETGYQLVRVGPMNACYYIFTNDYLTSRSHTLIQCSDVTKRALTVLSDSPEDKTLKTVLKCAIELLEDAQN